MRKDEEHVHTHVALIHDSDTESRYQALTITCNNQTSTVERCRSPDDTRYRVMLTHFTDLNYHPHLLNAKLLNAAPPAPD